MVEFRKFDKSYGKNVHTTIYLILGSQIVRHKTIDRLSATCSLFSCYTILQININKAIFYLSHCCEIVLNKNWTKKKILFENYVIEPIIMPLIFALTEWMPCMNLSTRGILLSYCSWWLFSSFCRVLFLSLFLFRSFFLPLNLFAACFLSRCRIQPGMCKNLLL